MFILAIPHCKCTNIFAFLQIQSDFFYFFVKIGVFINIYIVDCLGDILLKLL